VAKIISSAKQVQEANDVKYDEVPVPEWGEDGNDPDLALRIRSLTARELITFTSLKGENQKQAIVRGLIMSAVDEQGERIFDESDIKWLMGKNVSVLHRIQDAILVLNGMKQKPVQLDENGEPVEEDDELTKAGKG
jgi:hypothetical protein